MRYVMRPQTPLRLQTEEVIVETLKMDGPFSTTELIRILNGVCGKSSIYNRIDVLEARGKIKYVGPQKRSALWVLNRKR